MLDFKSAMAIAEKNYPSKKIRGKPAECDRMFLFHFVEKSMTEDEAKWDSTVIGVDKETGKCSIHSLWDIDIIKNATPIAVD